MANLNIIKVTGRKPAYSKYAGQLHEQPSYIRLDIDGELYLWTNQNINGTPADVYHGFCRLFPVPSTVTCKQLNFLMNYYQGLFQKILNGFSTEWNGNNNVGVLDAKASQHYLDLLSKIEQFFIED